MNQTLGLLTFLAALGAGCSKTDASALKKPKGVNKLEYPVQVAPLERRQVRYTVMAPGSIEAFQQVQITARVAGAVDKVAFVEGQVVKQGDLLAVIESERYEIAVGQAKAAVDKATANEQSAEANLARRQGAVADHPGLVPGEEVAQFQTSVATAKADVAAAQQALRVADLNLRDAFVRAPFAGAIQSRTVQAGQYLQTGAVLGTLLQRDPLLLRFPVSEQDAPRIKVGMTANLSLRESPRAYAATIILVAEAADPTTRLVQVTAKVDDEERKYWLRPGAFCEVDVPVGNARQAIVVPTIAVQPTDKGNVVYLVDAKNIAHVKGVSLGMHTPEGGVEVTQGLDPGELIVVRGFEPLTEGAPVKITERTTLQALEGDTGDAGAPESPGTAEPSPSTPSPAHSGRSDGAAP